MLRQFDCVRLPNGSLVVVLQDDIVSNLAGRVVAPLVSPDRLEPVTRGLNPVVYVDGRTWRVKVELTSAVPLKSLSPAIANVGHQRDEMIRALDLLFTGV
ncbi:MAG: CcdB family protein [Paracoccaceae bacterium]